MAHKHEIMGQGFSGPDVLTVNGMHVHALPGGLITPPAENDINHNHGLAELGMPVLIEQMMPQGAVPGGFMPQEFAKDLKTIKGVEVFAAGTWNGDTYTIEDLDGIVEAFNENKATLKPFLKLGHNREQKMLSQDGLPAAGWLDNVRRTGDKLVADFVDIPRKIFELIENKAFRNVSSEIYWNIDINGKVYKRFLSAVALLGANMPAVGTLQDILSLYTVKDSERENAFAGQKTDVTVKVYDFDREDASAPESMEGNEPMAKEQETDLKKFEAEIAALKAERDALAGEKAELETKATEAETKVAEFSQKLEDQETDAFIEGLVSEDLCTPAMKPYMKELLGAEKKEYSIESKAEDGAVNKKDFSKRELVKELLKLHGAKAGMSTEGQTAHTDPPKGDGARQDEQEAKIATYMKVTGEKDYKAAYKAVKIDSKDEMSIKDIEALA